MTDCTAVSISRFSDKNAVIYRPQHSPEGTNLMTDCTAVSISRFSDKNAVIYRPQQSCATHIAIYYGTAHK